MLRQSLEQMAVRCISSIASGRLHRHVTDDGTDRTRFLYNIRNTYPYASDVIKEETLIHIIHTYPEVIAWAMLRNANKESGEDGISDKSYHHWNDDIEAELLMSIGYEDIEILITYIRMYCPDFTRSCHKVKNKIISNERRKRTEKLIRDRKEKAIQQANALAYAV